MKEIDMHIKKQKLSVEFLMSSVIPRLLLSVSIFSFVFSYSSSSSKFHYFSSSNNYFHLLSHALNKNCLFLICNGLLVFVAKTSGFVHPPSADEINEMLLKRIGGDHGGSGHQLTLLEAKLEPLYEKFVLSQEVISNDDDQPKEEDDDDEGLANEVSIFIAESEEEDQLITTKKSEIEPTGAADESRKFWLFDEDEDDNDDDLEQLLYEKQVDEDEDHDEEEEEEDEKSREELNQKFEDFIRRMKEEIIINEATEKITSTGQKLAIMN